jgi:hypothetical protein
MPLVLFRRILNAFSRSDSLFTGSAFIAGQLSRCLIQDGVNRSLTMLLAMKRMVFRSLASGRVVRKHRWKSSFCPQVSRVESYRLLLRCRGGTWLRREVRFLLDSLSGNRSRELYQYHQAHYPRVATNSAKLFPKRLPRITAFWSPKAGYAEHGMTLILHLRKSLSASYLYLIYSNLETRPRL